MLSKLQNSDKWGIMQYSMLPVFVTENYGNFIVFFVILNGKNTGDVLTNTFVRKSMYFLEICYNSC